MLHTAPSVLGIIYNILGICMEEHTCEARLPHTKRKCGTKIGNIKLKGRGFSHCWFLKYCFSSILRPFKIGIIVLVTKAAYKTRAHVVTKAAYKTRAHVVRKWAKGKKKKKRKRDGGYLHPKNKINKGMVTRGVVTKAAYKTRAKPASLNPSLTSGLPPRYFRTFFSVKNSLSLTNTFGDIRLSLTNTFGDIR